MTVQDPFEQFKARKEIERLEKKIKSEAAVKAPAPAEVEAAVEPAPAAESAPAAPAATPAQPVLRPSKPSFKAFTDRSWIY